MQPHQPRAAPRERLAAAGGAGARARGASARTGAAFDEGRHATAWLAAAHGRYAGLGVVLGQDADVPIVTVVRGGFGQAAHGPRVAGLDEATPQEAVGFVK